GAPMVLPSPVGESVAANLLQGESLLDAFASNQEGFLLYVVLNYKYCIFEYECYLSCNICDSRVVAGLIS
ncbi:hypothetical protein, partial [Hymenobacter terrigena]